MAPKPRLLALVNKSTRVVLLDGRQLVGKLLAFDRHMNLILDEVQETRRTRAGKVESRGLGLVLLRGDRIVTAYAEDGPRPQAPRFALPMTATS